MRGRVVDGGGKGRREEKRRGMASWWRQQCRGGRALCDGVAKEWCSVGFVKCDWKGSLLFSRGLDGRELE